MNRTEKTSRVIMSRVLAALLVMILFTALTGCATLREQMTAAGYDPSYIDGYEHGHSSGYVAAGHPWYSFQKDTYRFDSDSQYRQGWNDGFQVAKGQYESIQRRY